MATTTVHDDYLICREYEAQMSKKSSTHPDFITFQHNNGNHYFAWVYNNEIVLRSEAYPDAEKMERGILAIKKNWDLAERYSIQSEHGAYFLVLWGGGDKSNHTGGRDGHSEIGRSCPKNSKNELNALLQGKGKDFANKVVAYNANEVVSESTTKTSSLAAASSVAATASAVSNTTNSAKTETVAGSNYAAANNDTSSGGGMGWLKWLLPLLLIGAALWAWKSCNKTEDSTTATTATTEEVKSAEIPNSDTTVAIQNNVTGEKDTVTIAAKETTSVTTTESTKIKLADGKEINAYKNGVEDKLVTFLNNKSATFNADDKKNNWYDFDNLNFDLGKSTITSASMVQVQNLADILKAYPGLKIKVGGYTDKKGDDKANMALSQSRADAVITALKAKGANAAQLTGAEGYGETLATVAESASDEARRVDRRTAVRVMAR